MRTLLRRSCGRHHRPEATTTPGRYRSRTYTPLGPWQVRGRRFGLARWWRRGLDPDEVTDFLDRVADDLTTLYDLLHRSRQETARVKDALRRWQTEYTNERSYR
ncbi:DivIVA domain-containing protein [Micromonospora cathayae]|uniref:DivIVA domain-containing protein n=1 Tax=Micromonospora cathayae TaxID=3028804 RepID=A0ABY7ZTN6_9ACTN|nr:DivIVA domain-containing protein [Micromonospora sp. HUAS 3]WDZ85388.1 DivIVA domain-containing protein [Micromonospora sp. HUAS 3]